MPLNPPIKEAEEKTPLLRVFLVFLRLGCVSFGGPIAHIGFFRDTFVVRRKWLSESDFAGLVSLTQLLPGPSSSQTGFAIGYRRAGWKGAIAAWAGFTLPSAVLMTALAVGLLNFDLSATSDILRGLKCAAVAVVAQAVWSMARSFCGDSTRTLIALASCSMVLALHHPAASFASILLAGLMGSMVLKGSKRGGTAAEMHPCVSPREGGTALITYLFLAVFLSVCGSTFLSVRIGLFRDMFMVGSFVVGGGHVVLPLMETRFVVPGGMDHQTFLAGYGAAQALPGPLFTFSAYVGAMSYPGLSVVGALIGLIGIFLPGMLLLVMVYPHWIRLYGSGVFLNAISGANAGVVGLMAGAWIHPIAGQSLHQWEDLAISGLVFALLQFKKIPIWAVVLFSGCLGWMWG